MVNALVDPGSNVDDRRVRPCVRPGGQTLFSIFNNRRSILAWSFFICDDLFNACSARRMSVSVFIGGGRCGLN